MILLSFDTEEFDVPKEHGVNISLEEGMRISVEGTNKILDCLQQNGVHATFFCTANFAEQSPQTIRRIMQEGHEVACHGVRWGRRTPMDESRLQNSRRVAVLALSSSDRVAVVRDVTTAKTAESVPKALPMLVFASLLRA